MRAVIYTRQSKDSTGEGMAVARQAEACRKHCEARGWTVVATLTDNDVSASTGKPRPEYERALSMAEAGEVDVIVCWAVDRLTRRVLDLERIIEICERTGVRVSTVSGDLDMSTDAGRLVARILASVARGEVERKGARQRAAAEQRARAGQPSVWGRRMFGYDDRREHLVPTEAQAIRDAARTIIEGGSIRAVARDWEAAGHRPMQGAASWSAQAVRGVLLNPAIAGIATYRGDTVGAAQWPAVVDADTFEAVRGILTSPTRRPPAGVASLLAGLARCRCGAVMWAGRSSRGAQVYKCRTYVDAGPSPAGGHASRAAGPVDDFVFAVAAARLSRSDAADLMTGGQRPGLDSLRERRLTLSTRLDGLAEAFAAGDIDRAQLAAGTARLKADLTAIDRELVDAQRAAVLGPLISAKSVEATLRGYDLDRQRAVIGLLMSVTLHPVGRGVRSFDPSTVEIDWHA